MKQFKLFLTLVMCFGMALSIEAQSFYLKTAKGNYISCNESGVLTNGTTKQEWNVSFEGIKAYVSTTVSGNTLYMKLDEGQIKKENSRITSKFIGSTTKTEIYLFDGSKGSANVDLMTSVAGGESRYLVSPKITVSTTEYCGYYIFRHDYSDTAPIDAKLMVIDTDGKSSDSYEIYSDPITSDTQINISTSNSASDNTRLIFEAIPAVQYAQVKLGDYDKNMGTASISGVNLNETFNSGEATANATKTLTLTATPIEGYKLKGWKLNGSDITVTNNSYTLTYFGTEAEPGVYEFTPVFVEKGTLAGTKYYLKSAGSGSYYLSLSSTPSLTLSTTNKQVWGVQANANDLFKIATSDGSTIYDLYLNGTSIGIESDKIEDITTKKYNCYLYSVDAISSSNRSASLAKSISTSKYYLIVITDGTNWYFLSRNSNNVSATKINDSSSSTRPRWSSNTAGGSSTISLASSSSTPSSNYFFQFEEAFNYYGKVTANATTGGKVIVNTNSTASSGFDTSSEQTWGAMENNVEKTWYFHAKADNGYEFMAWAEDAEGKKAVSTDKDFKVNVTAISDDSNDPTEKQYYAIFRKTESSSSLGTNEYYIINGTNYLSEHASDGESILLSSDAQAWTFTYSSNKFTIQGKEYLRCENQSGYVFNTSGSSKDVYIFDKDGKFVTSITSGNYYYLVQNNYLMSNEAISYSNNHTGLAAIKATTSGTGSSMKLTVPTKNAENYQFIISKTAISAPVEVTVSSAGYATYCSDKDLIVPADETVFGAKSKGDVVSLISVEKDFVIKAGTGFIIKKIGGGTVTFDVSEEAGNDISDNELVGTTKYESFDEGEIYLLGLNGDKVAFMLNKTGHLLAPNKAYLKVANTQPLAKEILEIDEATGIESVNAASSKSSKMFNLNGMRVNKNYKGLIIKNGKKFFLK